MKPLRFTEADVDRAFNDWGCNCGPGAIAAVLGMTLDELRPHLGDFERKRYTNPTLMWRILNGLEIFHTVSHRPPGLPRYGLARVQWEGPWLAPGVDPRAAYRQTHWIGASWCERRQAFGVFDINCMNSGGWVAFTDWQRVIVPHILKTCVPRASGGWQLTHAVAVTI